MSNETPVEGGHWKDKLDCLDQLSGEAWTGKDAAWDTLYGRLKDKPRRGKHSWHWMAASVLLAAGISLAIGIAHEGRPGPAGPVKPALASGRLPAPSDAGRPVTGALAPAAGTGAQEIVLSGAGRKNRQYVPNRKESKGGRPARDSVAVSPVPPAISPPPADMPPIVSIAVPPPQKKLPVLSVNELPAQPGADEETRGGGSPDRYFIQFKLGNSQFYSETAIESAHPGSDILHLKIRR